MKDSFVQFRRRHGFQLRQGFSFVEVMFAVVVLGVGFIMVSAMFPVAIQQTQITVEEAGANRAALAAQGLFNGMTAELTQIAGVQSAGILKTWYYSWPMSAPQGGSNVSTAGYVLGFRDPRWGVSFDFPQVVPPGAIGRYRFPPIGTNASANPNNNVVTLWERIRSGMVSPSEPQFAFVPLYQRGWIFDPTPLAAVPVPDTRVTIYTFLVASRYSTVYSSPSDVRRTPKSAGDINDANYCALNAPPANTQSFATLEPRCVQVRVHLHGDYPTDPLADPTGAVDLIEIFANASAVSYTRVDSPDAAGPGGFVIISNDSYKGQANGTVLRLGALRTQQGTHSYLYELQPGNDIASNQVKYWRYIPGFPATATLDAYILGRAWNPSAGPTGAYEGPVQDVAVQSFTLSASPQ